jgi:hypothetical protein
MTSSSLVQIPEHLSSFLNKLNEQYKKNPSVELECRIGIYDPDQKRFSSSVSSEYFYAFLKLSSAHPKTFVVEKEWITKTLVYYSDGTRYCYEDNKLEQINVLHQYNMGSQTKGLYDLRFSLKEEIPITDVNIKNKPRIVESIRVKKTKPFEITKTKCRLDFSIVELYSSDISDGCVSKTHEIEQEDTSHNTSSVFNIHNFLLESVCLLGRGFDQNVIDSLYIF